MATITMLFTALTLSLQVVLLIAINYVNDTVLKVYELVCNESDKIQEKMDDD